MSAWERARRVRPAIWDGLLAVCVFVGSILAGSSIGTYPRGGHGEHEAIRIGSLVVQFNGGGLEAVILVAVACAALIWRRRAPIWTLALVAAATAAYQFGGFNDGIVGFALIVAVYTVAAHRERSAVLTIGLPIALAAGTTMVAVGNQPDRGPVEILATLVALVGLPMLFGRISFNRRRRIERDRERAAFDAVSDERARIARELHDVVAHAMSVMVVQSGAARTVIERDPEQAAAALQRIEDTGRTGLAEMRRLVGVLETDGKAADLDPQPGLERLDELVETMRATGLAVDAVVEGTQRGLPPGIDLTAYRVVQEALTNVLKHSGRGHARVLLRYGGEALELEIADDGRGPGPEDADAPGHGLIGMRERVALFGGSLHAGARPGGGFVVRATIPISDSA